MVAAKALPDGVQRGDLASRDEPSTGTGMKGEMASSDASSAGSGVQFLVGQWTVALPVAAVVTLALVWGREPPTAVEVFVVVLLAGSVLAAEDRRDAAHGGRPSPGHGAHSTVIEHAQP
jgi:hypothetical protein